MNNHDVVMRLRQMNPTEFEVCVVQATIQRGENAPRRLIKSLASLMSTIAVTLSAHDKVNTAEIFRDVADRLEADAFKVKTL